MENNINIITHIIIRSEIVGAIKYVTIAEPTIVTVRGIT
jgi:hypothetical protein